MTPAAAAAAAAREHYGRLLAWLAWQWRDIAAAEDALGDAFARALERWPLDGVPQSPQAWLLSVARRRLLEQARRQRLSEDPRLTVLWPDEREVAPEAPAVPDARLRLMLVCAHPAIDASVRSPLMLQTVLGLEASRIASAFLVKPEAMTKRLVRAKAKIRSAGIAFDMPEPAEWPERLGAVLEAIYGAYTLQWQWAENDLAGDLAEEALYLATLVAAHLPQDAEALGLLSLLSLCEARRRAYPSQGSDLEPDYVPMSEQDPARWDGALLVQAEQCLGAAAALAQPGPLQLEAAIQSAHMHGVQTGATPWDAILALHGQLQALEPTTGAMIASAVALAQAGQDPQRGLQALEALREDQPGALADHQPWWAARAHLLRMAGDIPAASAAYERAAALTARPALKAWLLQQRGRDWTRT